MLINESENNLSLSLFSTNYIPIDNINYINNKESTINLEDEGKESIDLSNIKLDEIEFGSKILCPEKNCFSNSIISLDPFSFEVNYDCGKHKNKMNIIEYALNAGKSKEISIKCFKCEKKYFDIQKEKNMLYKCYCGNNYCEECKKNHLKEVQNKNEHNMIDYNEKDYLCCCCDKDKKYIEYCLTCKKNLCIICSESHRKHEKKIFGNMHILSEQEKIILNQKREEQKNKINKFNKIINNWSQKVNIIINIIKKKLELYNKINDIIFNQNDSNKIFYEEIKNVQNIRFDFDNDFLDILNSENDFIEQNKLICKLLNKNIEIKRHKLINKKMFNNIILKAEKSIKGKVKTICEIKKEKFLIINIIDKNNRENISFFKKSITENEYNLKISTDEDGNILDVIELKDGNLLIVKDKQFKIIELCIPELLIKNVQTKILENEYFKEIKEMSNGYLISSSFNNNEINQNKIVIWKKDLINGNYEIFKIYQGFQKALSILEINNYKFVSYFEDNTLFSYNLKLKKTSNILLTIKIKKIFKKMIQVGKNGILLIFNQSLILFNLENSQYSLLKIYYDINSICSIDNSKKYFLASYSKDQDFGLFLLDINLHENKIYKIKKIFIKNAHSKVINCIYRLSDEIFITGSSDNTYKIWELK